MRVLITGATGSLGHALVRRWQPLHERIVVFSRDEVKQAVMAQQFPQDNIRYFLGDVRDRRRLEQAMVGCDTVIHAAALKRVDAVAYNPEEVAKTNVNGTRNVIQAADGRCAKVVVVSSDKAVEPTNVYGATKCLAEHLAVAANVYAVPHGTRVSAVRYGNVAWSRGSVLWTWSGVRDNHYEITDFRMTRFWLTLDQAVDTIELALAHMRGGEIFVPRIKAARLTRFIDLLAPVCKVQETGLRPGGEKLHEVLIGHEEGQRTEDWGHYWTIEPALPTWRKADAPIVHPVSRYSSDTAPQMSNEEIRALIASKP